jgi:hypothetical protein
MVPNDNVRATRISYLGTPQAAARCGSGAGCTANKQFKEFEKPGVSFRLFRCS